jgi:hypothetical protein
VRRALFGVALVAVATASCSSDGSSARFPAVLCPTVQAWSDQSVGVVNTFSDHSRAATSAAQRRQLYESAFGGLEQQLDQLATRLAKLPTAPTDPAAVTSALRGAITAMRAALGDAESTSAALPDGSYEIASVSNGKLFTGLEKNQAIVYQALSDLSDRYGAEVVPRGCGRRGAVDLSPSVTAP